MDYFQIGLICFQFGLLFIWGLLSYFANRLDSKQAQVSPFFYPINSGSEGFRKHKLTLEMPQPHKKSKFGIKQNEGTEKSASSNRDEPRQQSPNNRRHRANSFDEDQSPTRKERVEKEKQDLEHYVRAKSRKSSIRQPTFHSDQGLQKSMLQLTSIAGNPQLRTVQEVMEDSSPAKPKHHQLKSKQSTFLQRMDTFKSFEEEENQFHQTKDTHVPPPQPQSYKRSSVDEHKSDGWVVQNLVDVGQNSRNMNMVNIFSRPPSIAQSRGYAESQREDHPIFERNNKRSWTQLSELVQVHRSKTKKTSIMLPNGNTIESYKIPSNIPRRKKSVNQESQQAIQDVGTNEHSSNLNIQVTNQSNYNTPDKDHSILLQQRQNHNESSQSFNLLQNTALTPISWDSSPEKRTPKQHNDWRQINIFLKIFSTYNRRVSRSWKLLQLYVRLMEVQAFIGLGLWFKLKEKFDNSLIWGVALGFVLIKRFIDDKLKRQIKKSADPKHTDEVPFGYLIRCIAVTELLLSCIVVCIGLVVGSDFEYWVYDTVPPLALDLFLLDFIIFIIYLVGLEKEKGDQVH